MSARPKHANCSVQGCKHQHQSLHRLPVSEDRRTQWLDFVFDGNVPAQVGKNPMVCANHFLPDCFTNLGQYEAGLAGKLCLKAGATPTVRDQTAEQRAPRDRSHHARGERPAKGCSEAEPRLEQVGEAGETQIRAE